MQRLVDDKVDVMSTGIITVSILEVFKFCDPWVKTMNDLPMIDSKINSSQFKESLDKPSLMISYSHRDQEWFSKFEEMFVGKLSLDVWSDKELKAGDNWDREIQKSIAEARVVLLLVSPSFLASEYISKRELPRIFEAQKEKRLNVIWVKVRSVPNSLIPPELSNIQSYKNLRVRKNCPM